MKLKDFEDLGFTVKTTYENTPIRVVVCKEEDSYQQVLAFAKQHGDWDEISKYARTLDCCLGPVSYQNGELIGVRLVTYKPGTRYYTVVGDISLFIEVVDGVVVNVNDMCTYFHSVCNFNCLYEKDTLGDDDVTAAQLLKQMYDHRLRNAQDIRNYYNKEIKDLKQSYRNSLEQAKAGLDFLKQFS